ERDDSAGDHGIRGVQNGTPDIPSGHLAVGRRENEGSGRDRQTGRKDSHKRPPRRSQGPMLGSIVPPVLPARRTLKTAPTGNIVCATPPNCINVFAAIPGTPTAHGGLTKPMSASLGSGPTYIGPWIQPARPSISSSRPSATLSRQSIFYRWP